MLHQFFSIYNTCSPATAIGSNDTYHGPAAAIIARRKRTKRETIKKKRTEHWEAVAVEELEAYLITRLAHLV